MYFGLNKSVCMCVCTAPSSIGHPFNIKHNIHVELDVDGAGFKGLPKEWRDKVPPLLEKKRRATKIVESPDSLFHSDLDLPKQRTKRESRQLHLSTNRNSLLKANVMKAVQIIQDSEKGKMQGV